MSTTSEVNALRKAGDPDKALEMGEQLFAERPDSFTAGALFWVLYDLSKKATEIQEISDLFDRMKKLHDDYEPENEYQQRSLQSVESRLNPLRELSWKASQKAKAGEDIGTIIDELAAKIGTPEMEDQRVRNNFGWAIYQTLKHTDTGEVDKRKRLLGLYLKLELPRPDLLHSLILEEAFRVEKNTPYQFLFRNFLNLWGLENLREEDWTQGKGSDGRVYNALVEKVISAQSKELIDDKATPTEAFKELVDKALLRFPNNQYMPLYKARVLIADGRKEEAVEFYKKMILKGPKGYLWTQAADLIDDTEMQMAMLCKAIVTERDEVFLGDGRLRLAALLLEKGLPGNARYELDKYREFYQQKGWILKKDYQLLDSKIGPGTAPVDNSRIYAEYADKTDAFIYNDIPAMVAVKVNGKMLDDKNSPGRQFMQWTLRTATGPLRLKKPAKFGLASNMPDGALFSAKVADGRIVWIEPLAGKPDAADNSWLTTAQGTVRSRIDRKGNPYTFINDIYVGGRLLANVGDGDMVDVVAVMDPEQNKWRALSLKKI